MRAHTRWEREFIKKKKVEIAKLRKFVKEEVGFFFFIHLQAFQKPIWP